MHNNNNLKDKLIFIDVPGFSLYVSNDINYIVLRQKDANNYYAKLSVVWNNPGEAIAPRFDKEYQTIDIAEQDYSRLISYFSNDFVDFKFDRNRIFIPPDKIVGTNYEINNYGTEEAIQLIEVMFNEGNLEFIPDSKSYFLDLATQIARFKTENSPYYGITQSYLFIDLPLYSCYMPTNFLNSLILYNKYVLNQGGSYKPTVIIGSGMFAYNYPFSTFGEAQKTYESLVNIFNRNPNEFVEFTCGESKIYADKYFVGAATYETGYQNNQDIKISRMAYSSEPFQLPNFLLKHSSAENIKPDYISLVAQIRKYSTQNNQKIAKQPRITDQPIYKNVSLWAKSKNNDSLKSDWCLIDEPNRMLTII